MGRGPADTTTDPAPASGDNNGGCFLNKTTILGVWSNPEITVGGSVKVLACTYTYLDDDTVTVSCPGVLKTYTSQYFYDIKCNEVSFGDRVWTVTGASTMQTDVGGYTAIQTKQ